jgi:ML domain
VHAAGRLSKDIEVGAYIKLQVKFNKYITILKTTIDLCEQVKAADKECPLEEGEIQVVKEFTLPEEIPKVSN